MELVSPDDLRTAAELFESLQLPVSLRVFPSGVAVVQDRSWSDDAVCMAIVDVLSKDDGSVVDSNLGRGLSCTQYAVEASVPVAVATEQLLLAERKGFVCRDDGPSGLYFFRNWFAEV
jgi:ESCRT-II complex subunit VPS36